MKTIILLTLLLASCSITDPDSKPDSTYPQLQGTYTYSEYTTDGVYEDNKYISYTFDNTGIAEYNTCIWSYTVDGWFNVNKVPFTYNVEWKIDGDILNVRYYDNSDGIWSDYGFEWVDDSSIKINGLTYTKD